MKAIPFIFALLMSVTLYAQEEIEWIDEEVVVAQEAPRPRPVRCARNRCPRFYYFYFYHYNDDDRFFDPHWPGLRDDSFIDYFRR